LPLPPDWLCSSSADTFRKPTPFQPWLSTRLASFLHGPRLQGVNPELGSFRHFPSPPPSGPVRKPVPARAHFAGTPLVVRQAFDSIGINSKLGSFRHFLSAP
jgi:hypothetical protein